MRLHAVFSQAKTVLACRTFNAHLLEVDLKVCGAFQVPDEGLQ
jgi:hypothetical protein